MDCLENENVCSVKKENNIGYYRLHTIWNNNGFRVNIASKDGAWTGEMKPENVQSMSNELKVDPEKYLLECKEVLTTDDGKKGYFYMVENGSFTWKKMIDEDSGMKIRMGSIMLQPVSFVDTIQNIIEVALNCKKNLNEQLNSLRHEKERDHQRISQLQKKLEELCDKKNVMEIDLYSKFILILNSKKRKIHELEVSALAGKESSEKSEKLMHSECSEKHKVGEINISEAYEMDTEDEDDFQKKGNMELHHTVPCDSANFVSTVIEKVPYTSLEYSESDVNRSENTTDFDVPTGSRTIPGTSNADNSSDNSDTVKDKKNSFPNTKADILDFFFGPT